MKTIYEWCVNEMDAEDILDNHFSDTLNDSNFKPSDIDGVKYQLELVMTKYKEDGELVERLYATADGSSMAECFEEGGSIPARFRKELKAWG